MSSSIGSLGTQKLRELERIARHRQRPVVKEEEQVSNPNRPIFGDPVKRDDSGDHVVQSILGDYDMFAKMMQYSNQDPQSLVGIVSSKLPQTPVSAAPPRVGELFPIGAKGDTTSTMPAKPHPVSPTVKHHVAGSSKSSSSHQGHGHSVNSNRHKTHYGSSSKRPSHVSESQKHKHETVHRESSHKILESHIKSGHHRQPETKSCDHRQHGHCPSHGSDVPTTSQQRDISTVMQHTATVTVNGILIDKSGKKPTKLDLQPEPELLQGESNTVEVLGILEEMKITDPPLNPIETPRKEEPPAKFSFPASSLPVETKPPKHIGQAKRKIILNASPLGAKIKDEHETVVASSSLADDLAISDLSENELPSSSRDMQALPGKDSCEPVKSSEQTSESSDDDNSSSSESESESPVRSPVPVPSSPVEEKQDDKSKSWSLANFLPRNSQPRSVSPPSCPTDITEQPKSLSSCELPIEKSSEDEEVIVPSRSRANKTAGDRRRRNSSFTKDIMLSTSSSDSDDDKCDKTTEKQGAKQKSFSKSEEKSDKTQVLKHVFANMGKGKGKRRPPVSSVENRKSINEESVKEPALKVESAKPPKPAKTVKSKNQNSDDLPDDIIDKSKSKASKPRRKPSVYKEKQTRGKKPKIVLSDSDSSDEGGSFTSALQNSSRVDMSHRQVGSLSKRPPSPVPLASDLTSPFTSPKINTQSKSSVPPQKTYKSPKPEPKHESAAHKNLQNEAVTNSALKKSSKSPHRTSDNQQKSKSKSKTVSEKAHSSKEEKSTTQKSSAVSHVNARDYKEQQHIKTAVSNVDVVHSKSSKRIHSQTKDEVSLDYKLGQEFPPPLLSPIPNHDETTFSNAPSKESCIPVEQPVTYDENGAAHVVVKLKLSALFRVPQKVQAKVKSSDSAAVVLESDDFKITEAAKSVSLDAMNNIFERINHPSTQSLPKGKTSKKKKGSENGKNMKTKSVNKDTDKKEPEMKPEVPSGDIQHIHSELESAIHSVEGKHSESFVAQVIGKSRVRQLSGSSNSSRCSSLDRDGDCKRRKLEKEQKPTAQVKPFEVDTEPISTHHGSSTLNTSFTGTLNTPASEMRPDLFWNHGGTTPSGTSIRPSQPLPPPPSFAELPEERVKPVSEYLQEARQLKHTADAITDKPQRAASYLEACMKFIQTISAMEAEKTEQNMVKQMIRQTALILRHVINYRTEGVMVDSRVLFLSMRSQSLLNQKMFHMKRDETMRNHKQIMDYMKKQPHGQIQKPTQTASPYQAPNWTMKSTGTPSPVYVSPTPSPSSSTSVTSQGATTDRIICDKHGNQVSSTTVMIPQRMFTVMQQQWSNIDKLLNAQYFWDQSDHLLSQDATCKTFIENLDKSPYGPLTWHSDMMQLVRYVTAGLMLVRSHQNQ